jgi:hypothetical protein
MQDLTLNTDTPKRWDRRRTLAITAVAMVAVYILWNLDVFSFIVYPLRLFVTYVHEAGHGLMTLLTGGQVHSFIVSPDTSGLTTSRGGIRALIIPAGYLGAAFFGSMMFVLINRLPRYINNIAIIVGAGLVAFTLIYARPDESGNLSAIIIGVAFGVFMILLGAKAPTLITLLLLNVLAVSTSLNAVLDLWQLISSIDATRGSVGNDAAAFSRDIAPLIPPTFIALTWAILAVMMFGAATYYGVWKPLRNEINETYARLVNR